MTKTTKKTTDKSITAVVLAAGKSTRVKQDLPKVITPLGGRPLIFHLLDTLTGLRRYVKDIVVVLGYKKEIIEPVIRREFPEVRFAYQKKMDGTARAVAAAMPAVKKNHTLILCADAPLVKTATLKDFISGYLRKKKDGSVITSRLDDDNDLGRIERDKAGNVLRIIEKKDLGNRDLKEVNSGIYLFRTAALAKNLEKIKMNPKKREYYFTDIVEIFSCSGLAIGTFLLADWEEMIGINDQQALALAYKILNKRYLDEIMSRGIRVIDPDTTYINYNVKIGSNSVIYPFTFIEKDAIIGNNCRIGPFVYLREKANIRDNTCIGGKSGNTFDCAQRSPFAFGKD